MSTIDGNTMSRHHRRASEAVIPNLRSTSPVHSSPNSETTINGVIIGTLASQSHVSNSTSVTVRPQPLRVAQHATLQDLQQPIRDRLNVLKAKIATSPHADDIEELKQCETELSQIEKNRRTQFAKLLGVSKHSAELDILVKGGVPKVGSSTKYAIGNTQNSNEQALNSIQQGLDEETKKKEKKTKCIIM